MTIGADPGVSKIVHATRVMFFKEGAPLCLLVPARMLLEESKPRKVTNLLNVQRARVARNTIHAGFPPLPVMSSGPILDHELHALELVQSSVLRRTVLIELLGSWPLGFPFLEDLACVMAKVRLRCLFRGQQCFCSMRQKQRDLADQFVSAFYQLNVILAADLCPQS